MNAEEQANAAEHLAHHLESMQVFVRAMYEHHLETPVDSDGCHAELEAMLKALMPWVEQQAVAADRLAGALWAARRPQAEVTR